MTSVTLGRIPRIGLTLGITIGGLGLFASPASATPSGTRNQPTHSSFTSGSGGSAAAVFGVNVPYAGANFGFGAGTTTANFFDSSANTAAESFNPEFLNLVEALKLCNSPFPISLPQPTTADTNTSRRFGVSHTHSYAGGSGGEAGRETATANRRPAGSANVALSGLALGGLVSLHGGTATSSVEVLPHQQERITTAIAQIGDLSAAGGLIALKGLRWSLVQRTVGPDNRTSRTRYQSSFSMAEMRVGAIVFHSPTAKQMTRGVQAMAAITKPLGMHIVLPVVTHLVGGAQYSPLQISFGGNVFYGKALATLLTGSHGSALSLLNSTGTTIFDPTHCKELAGLLSKAPPANVTWNFVGFAIPIVLQAMASAFTGGADIDLNFGGVSTSINDTYYRPPSGGALPPASTPPTAHRAAPSTSVSTRGSVSLSQTRREKAPSALGPAFASPAAFIRYLCRSDSPAGGGCLRNHAALAGIIAAVLGGGMFVVDEAWRRRRRRTTPPRGAA